MLLSLLHHPLPRAYLIHGFLRERLSKGEEAYSECSATSTFGLASSDIDEIVPSSVVRDPLYAGRKLLDEIRIKYADPSCGNVAPVYTNCAFIWTTRRKAC